MPPKDYKYKAFISYSHQDKKWGDWLHKALETYRVPKGLVGKETRYGVTPKRLFPIFRDREELPTSHELGKVINQALEDSSHLVVICSPRSAKSLWVNEEIKGFKRLGKADKVLCLIVDGEPYGADKPELGQEECFPEAIKYEIGEDGELSTHRTEPIAADAREGKDGKKNALLKLIAGLLDVGFNDLKQREAARKQKRMAIFSGVSFALVAIMAGLTFWALDQQQEAERQRVEAVTARDNEAEQRAEAERQREVAETERAEAQKQLKKANAISEFVQGLFTSVKPGELKDVDQGDMDLMKLVLGKGLEKIGELKNQPEVEADIRSVLGKTYRSLGFYDEALPHFEKALAIQLKTLGPEHPEVAIFYGDIGIIYGRKGEHDKALEHLEKALAITLKKYGPGHAQVAISYGQIGQVYMREGKHDKALEYFEKALAIRMKTLGPEHPHVAISYANIGIIYSKKGEHDKALEHLEKALAIKLKRKLHPTETYVNLGLVYSSKGEYDKAVEYFEKALVRRLKTHGPSHPFTKGLQAWIDRTKKLKQQP